MRRAIRAVAGRWPAAVAVGLTLLTLDGNDTAEGVRGLAEALMLLPLLYLVVAKLQRRNASWPVLGILIVPFIGLRAFDVVPPTAVVSVVALAVLIWGAVDGQLRKESEFTAQALAMVGFAAFALVGLVIDPDIGRYVVAAGWFLHGVWDFVHLWRNQTVARSYAEWCGVLDILIAASLILAV